MLRQTVWQCAIIILLVHFWSLPKQQTKPRSGRVFYWREILLSERYGYTMPDDMHFLVPALLDNISRLNDSIHSPLKSKSSLCVDTLKGKYVTYIFRHCIC